MKMGGSAHLDVLVAQVRATGIFKAVRLTNE
jgi:hypothetical protein